MVKLIVALLLLAVAAALALWYLQTQRAATEGSGDVYTLQQVRRGTVTKTVYGSGTIQAANQPTLLSGTSGTVTSLPVSVGDTVQAGDVLLVMENQTLDSDISTLEYSLWEKDISIASSTTGSEVTGVKAPVGGRVMQLSVQPGDDALAIYREYGSVAILSTDGRMKVDFEVQSAPGLSLGDTVAVSGDGFSMDATITDLFMQGTRATATLLTDELPMDAPVTIAYAGETIGEGTLAINKPLAVSAHGGTVEEVRVQVGDVVSQKMTLFTLSDAPISLEMENLRMQRENIADSLETAVSQRESLIVTAPTDGVIASVSVAVGDTVQSGAVLLSLIEGEEMVLSIAVDELDVVEVASGQPVSISVDALPDLALSGTVEKIAPVGTGSGGVSSYDVALNFSAEGTGVKPGMNASGEVQVASAQNALYVPVEALMTIGDAQFVMVYAQADAGAGAQATATPAQAEADTPADDATPNAAAQGDTPQGDIPQGDTPQADTPQGNMPQRSAADGEAGQGSFTRGNRQDTGETLSEEEAAALAEARAARTGSAGGTEGFAGFSGGASPLLSVSLGTTTEEGTLRQVETGIGNDDYVQIVSGLSEGEIVMYQSTASSSNASTMTVNRMMNSAGSGLTSVTGGMMR